MYSLHVKLYFSTLLLVKRNILLLFVRQQDILYTVMVDVCFLTTVGFVYNIYSSSFIKITFKFISYFFIGQALIYVQSQQCASARASYISSLQCSYRLTIKLQYICYPKAGRSSQTGLCPLTFVGSKVCFQQVGHHSAYSMSQCFWCAVQFLEIMRRGRPSVPT